MKKLYSLFMGMAMILAFAPAQAQLELPAPSPAASVSQTVGLTEITVDYSSPGVKGRDIYGSLVPYGDMWRTGANRSTKITFSKDVMMGGKTVPAGSYSLFTIPNQNEWTIIINEETGLGGTSGYEQSKDVVRFTVKLEQMANNRERMAFIFSDFDEQKANLDLEWAKTRVRIPINVMTDQQALSNIDNAVRGTASTYAAAARYLVENKKDLDRALNYANQAIAINDSWYNNWIKAQVLAEKGSYKEATAAAQKAKELGDKSENFFYKDRVEKALAEWKNKK